MRGDILLQNDKVIPAWVQPIALLDLCHARGVALEKLLVGTSLFADQIPFHGQFISPRHYSILLDNAERHWPGDDFAFQLGHHLANTALGPLGPLLDRCEGADQYLDALCQFAYLLNPLLRLRRCVSDDSRVLLLLSSCCYLSLTPCQLRVAITALSHLLTRLPDVDAVEGMLSIPSPANIAQYLSHVAAQVYFDLPFDGVRISLQPQSAVAEGSASLSQQAARAGCETEDRGQYFLLSVLRRYWLDNGEVADLQHCAELLETSAATLKRRLGEQGCTFQAVLDSARREQALIELLVHGASIDAISEQLHFHDSSNFRRAFKRWTGMTPSLMKTAFKELASLG